MSARYNRIICPNAFGDEEQMLARLQFTEKIPDAALLHHQDLHSLDLEFNGTAPFTQASLDGGNHYYTTPSGKKKKNLESKTLVTTK